MIDYMRLIELQVDNHAGFHFGDASGNLKKSFSSDQLFSALVNNISKLYGDEKVELFISNVENNQIHFSSLFYGVKFISKQNKHVQKTIYFIPRPKVEIQPIGNISTTYKVLKKIEYVSILLYRKLSEQFNKQDNKCYIDFEETIIFSKNFALLKEELEGLDVHLDELAPLNFLHTNVNPGVEINRMTTMSENYFINEELTITYGETSTYFIQPFFYFFIDGEVPNYVIAAIHLLKDEGIGGKRTVGKGFLKNININEGPHILQRKGHYYLSLSSYFPAKGEEKQLFQYELEKRNGFIYSFGGTRFRKQSVMIVNEGSLFHEKVKGELIDIGHKSVAHSVYLYGKPMLIGFGGEKIDG